MIICRRSYVYGHVIHQDDCHYLLEALKSQSSVLELYRQRTKNLPWLSKASLVHLNYVDNGQKNSPEIAHQTMMILM